MRKLINNFIYWIYIGCKRYCIKYKILDNVSPNITIPYKKVVICKVDNYVTINVDKDSIRTGKIQAVNKLYKEVEHFIRVKVNPTSNPDINQITAELTIIDKNK